MSDLLRDALEETMKGWRDELPKPWQPVFEDVQLNASGVPEAMKHHPWVPIFPVFRPPHALGAPRFAHTFRAFKGVTPKKVRVVVVGQDPYPDVAKATGQSFEQGNLRDILQDRHRVSSSLRAILQNAAADKYRRTRYRDPKKGWDRLLGDLQKEKAELAPLRYLFTRYQKQGVLWLNTTLTISLFRSEDDHQKGHLAYWKPFVSALIKHVVSLDRPLVFALWGSWAKAYEPEIRKQAKAAGTLEHIAFAKARHPVVKQFLQGENVLTEVNLALQGFGEKQIDWFPA